MRFNIIKRYIILLVVICGNSNPIFAFDSSLLENIINRYDDQKEKCGLWCESLNIYSYGLSIYENGMKNGISVYFEKDKYGNYYLESVNEYRNGFPAGIWKIYYPNGKLRSVSYDFKIFEDFNLIPERRFWNRKAPLVQFYGISYYENGSLQSEGWYVAPCDDIELDVQEIGITKHYEVSEKVTKLCENVDLNLSLKQENSKFTDIKLVLDSLKIHDHSIINNIDKFGKREGFWIEDIGYGFSVKEFRNGIANGNYFEFILFDRNYKKIISGHYTNGIPSGNWIGFYPDGAIKFSISEIVENTICSSNFANKKEKDLQFFSKEYDHEGHLICDGWFIGPTDNMLNECIPVGKWTFYYEDGNVESEIFTD